MEVRENIEEDRRKREKEGERGRKDKVTYGKNSAAFNVDAMVVKSWIIRSDRGSPKVDKTFLPQGEKELDDFLGAQNLGK